VIPRSFVQRWNGLDHHVLEWALERSERDAGRATAIIVHGFQDAAATWEDVAIGLAGAGLRVLAPDMRGFGDGPRVPAGAYYYFPDYVADLAALVQAEAKGVPLLLVGHSMGAAVAAYFAGAFPERLTKLALIDGVGPPDNPANVAPHRMRRWIEGAFEAEERRTPMTRADALARLVRFNPLVDVAVLARKLPQLSRPAEGQDLGSDAVVWKGDPLHMTTSPLPFFAESYEAFARQVTCPVLYVSGGARGFHVPDEEERLASFPRLTRVTLEGGHSLHWTMPRELSAALVAFWQKGTSVRE
jgi:pimeloyl-ACP methyl ester carboxylesterase